MMSLRRATAADREFSESLARANMERYLSVLGAHWNSGRYAQDWQSFESFVIEVSGERVGVIRFTQEAASLYIRDLQVRSASQRNGVGTWAIHQVLREAKARGLALVTLKVSPQNPAKVLYERLGFQSQGAEGNGIKMAVTV
jgi:ribosomal protein S18 acetylase RimI-like enzyme